MARHVLRRSLIQRQYIMVALQVGAQLISAGRLRAFSWVEAQCCHWQWVAEQRSKALAPCMHKRQRLSTEKRALEGARRPSARMAACLRTARIARKDVNFEAPFGGLGSFSRKRSFFLEEYLLRAMFSVVNKDGAINLRDGRTLLTCPFFAGWTSSL